MTNVRGDAKDYYTRVGENIRKYRTMRNYSLQMLGEKIGLTKKTVQSYETGSIRIEVGRINAIADALNVDVYKLLEGAEHYLGIENLPSPEFIKLPIVGRICCGDGVIAFEEIEGEELTPSDWLNGGEYFYLRAKGDSMSGARIMDGDLLLMRRQDDVDDGEIGAVLVDDEAVLKRVYKRDGMLILQAENPSYAPMVYSTKDSKQIKIVGLLKRIIIRM